MSSTRALIIFLLLTKLVTFGQDKELITRYRPGVMWFLTGIRPAQPEKVRKYDRLIFDITYNDWIGRKTEPFKNNVSSNG